MSVAAKKERKKNKYEKKEKDSMGIRFILSFREPNSLLVERRMRDQKVVSLNPGRSSGRIFFSRVLTLCADSCLMLIPPNIPCYHSGM